MKMPLSLNCLVKISGAIFPVPIYLFPHYIFRYHTEFILYIFSYHSFLNTRNVVILTQGHNIFLSETKNSLKIFFSPQKGMLKQF